MAKSSVLFDLINSLDYGEKRYFKRYSRLHNTKGNNHYLLVFDELNKMQHYDEETIIKKLNLSTKNWNFSAEKTYLYNLILKCLRNYHAKKSMVNYLKELRIDANILLEKGLINQCLKRIRKAKKIAKDHDFNLELLEFLLMEGKIVGNQSIKDAAQWLSSQTTEMPLLMLKINTEAEMYLHYSLSLIHISEPTRPY